MKSSINEQAMATADPTFMRIYLNKSKELKSLMTSDIKGAQPKRTTWERREHSDPWSGIPTYMSKSMGPTLDKGGLPPISPNNSQLYIGQEMTGMNNVRPGAKNLDHLNRMMMNLPGSYQRLNQILRARAEAADMNPNPKQSPQYDRTNNPITNQQAQTPARASQSPYGDNKNSNSDVKLPALGRYGPGSRQESPSNHKGLLPHLQTSESLLVQGHLTGNKGFSGTSNGRLASGQAGQEKEGVMPPRYYLDGMFVKQAKAKPAGIAIDPQVEELRFFGGRKGRPLFPRSPPPQHDRKEFLHEYETAGLNVEPFSTKGQRFRRVSPDSQFIYQERAPQHVFDRVIDTRVLSASKNISDMRRTAIKEWERFTQGREEQANR